MLKAVDKILDLLMRGLVREQFSEIFTNRHQDFDSYNSNVWLVFLRFPQIHTGHHNNKLYEN